MAAQAGPEGAQERAAKPPAGARAASGHGEGGRDEYGGLGCSALLGERAAVLEGLGGDGRAPVGFDLGPVLAPESGLELTAEVDEPGAVAPGVPLVGWALLGSAPLVAKSRSARSRPVE